MVSAILRLLVYFVMDRVGRIIFGSLLLIAGIVWGMTSHTVTYHQTAMTGKYAAFTTMTDSHYYLNEEGSKDFYIVSGADFNAYLDLDPTYFDKMSNIVLIYKSDTQNVNLNLNDGSTVSGTGHQVVKFTYTDDKNQQQVYYTSEYALNPNGYTDDHWLLGKVGIGLGIALIAFSLLAPLVIRLLFGEDDQEVDENKLSPQAKMRALRKMNRSPWGRRSRSGGRSLGDMTK